MTRHSTEVTIEAAAVSDRGLNERRPLNEDSYFVDLERHVFAVADGVGGAEAGEVASETAIEVLEAAFKHQRDGEDIEDLLEIAIQRANDSIHRMSREHQRFASMATTVVALKVEGLRATVGHVGDSRLYRHTPRGELRRETDDHSVVEEEVRAGRMTPEQAQNHPSRNVISRALGAEADVEVDLKTFEIERGTTFLLCTDGITRHLSDAELRSLIGGARDLEAACQEMKRICFERGAEDNLTAVLVRVGGYSTPSSDGDGWDEERTLHIEKPRAPTASTAEETVAHMQETPVNVGYASAPDGTAIAPSPAPDTPRPQASAAVAPARRRGGAGRVIFVLFLLMLFSAAAFYGGMFYERRFTTEVSNVASNPPVAVVQPTSSATDTFEAERSRVDSAFKTEAERRANELLTLPATGEDPRALYLYGRALLLSNRPQEAAVQFEKAAEKIRQQPKSSQMSLLIDSQLANVTAHLKANDLEGAKRAADAFDTLLLGTATATDAAAQPSPAAAALASPQ